METGRRTFLRLLGGAVASTAIAGCNIPEAEITISLSTKKKDKADSKLETSGNDSIQETAEKKPVSAQQTDSDSKGKISQEVLQESTATPVVADKTQDNKSSVSAQNSPVSSEVTPNIDKQVSKQTSTTVATNVPAAFPSLTPTPSSIPTAKSTSKQTESATNTSTATQTSTPIRIPVGIATPSPMPTASSMRTPTPSRIPSSTSTRVPVFTQTGISEKTATRTSTRAPLPSSTPTRASAIVPSPSPTPYDATGKFCGGIAANLPENQCPTGYACKLNGNYPDAGGTCVKNSPFSIPGLPNINIPNIFSSK